MIKINQREAELLRENGFGEYVHISSSTHKSRAKRYFATEEKRCMQWLADYRAMSTVT